MVSTQRMSIEIFYNIWDTWIHAHMLHSKNLCETSSAYDIIFLYFSLSYYERVLTMEQILQQILQKLDNLENGQKNLENRFDNLESRFDNLESRFDNLENRFISLENEVKDMKSQLDENTQLTKAIYHRQEETDAKLENLSFNHHKLHGDVSNIKETLQNIKGDIQFTYEKTSQNELEIYRIKKDQQFASIARER